MTRSSPQTTPLKTGSNACIFIGDTSLRHTTTRGGWLVTTSAGVTIRRMAEAQNGLVTGKQAIAGLSRCVIRRRVSLGEWKCLGSDTYLIYGSPSAVVYLRAAVLALPAVVSHQSAAQLHGLGYEPFTGAVATVPSRRTYRFKGVQVHQSTDLHRRYVTRTAGFPVTNPIRTMFDLASVTEIDELRGIAQKALAAQGDLRRTWPRFSKSWAGGVVPARPDSASYSKMSPPGTPSPRA